MALIQAGHGAVAISSQLSVERAGITLAAFTRGRWLAFIPIQIVSMKRLQMSPDKMIRMANQIATFFKTQPGDDAPAKVAAHITDFWEPRMRAQLRDYAAASGEGLDDIVLKAVPLV
ncbi:formate dehydrogenase subunit delta [Thioclava sp. F34-6]|uniref:formate dehydrogenase subunit delta n=1 Tax=Thioclava sp. F34-6 TaxID=1973003 RepID=UPI0032047C11